MEKFKGVTYIQQAKGGVWFLKYIDPRFRKQVMRSTETTEIGIAERIARELSTIIYDKSQWDRPNPDFHPRTRQIWKPLLIEVKQAVDSIPLITKSFLEKLPPDVRDLPNHPETAQLERMIEMQDKIKELLEQLMMVTDERNTYRDENTRLHAQLRKMGVKAIKDDTPKPIGEAIDEFFDSGATEATGNWRYALRKYFNLLAAHVGGEHINARNISPEEVAKFIYSRQKSSSDTKRRLKIALCKFLRHATNEAFDERTLSELTKGLKKQAARESVDEWYWLTKEQALAICENMKLHGQFWNDAALLNYGTGIRPEEIPLLRTATVKVENGMTFIFPARIFDGKKLVRRVKTTDSEDYVHVPTFALEALHRRIAQAEFLLFPCYDYEIVPKRLRSKLTQFELEHKMWPVPSIDNTDDDAGGNAYAFSNVYIRLLRKAAKTVEGVSIDKVDSRIFRHTCARELILKHGFDRAASVLRDDVVTLRTHYADLVSSDTSTER